MSIIHNDLDQESEFGFVDKNKDFQIDSNVFSLDEDKESKNPYN